MFNILLDRLPIDYKGYLMRTSFRVGIQICDCLDDTELSDEEKMYVAITLLFGKGIPKFEDALEGLNWFMACGNPEYKSVGNNKKLFYWDFDATRIYSSFKQTYGIDLAKTDLHWFEFIAMIGSLDKDCSFNKAIEIRDYDIKDLKGKNRSDMQKMKTNLTPPVEMTDEEQQKLDEFNAQLGGDING